MYTYLVCGPFFREISQATSSLTFSTRNSILETPDSKLSRLEARGTVNLLLSGTVLVWAVIQTKNAVPY